MDGLKRLNALSTDEAVSELLECCGSRAWASAMAESRPFADRDALLERADEVWRGLGPDDWMEAFRAHPRIGERKGGGAEAGATERGADWSEEEQAGAREAGADVLERLAAGNRAYEERFGHIFLICATGKSAEEMLENLGARMENDPETELRVAAEEQRKITRIRLDKLLES